MAVAVLIPWRPGCPHREAAWLWVRRQYATIHPDWDVITGTCGDGPWIKADAVTDALRHTDADRILVADADVWCDGLQQAVDALDEFPWAIPHHSVNRLTEQATAAVLDGAPPGGSLTQRPYKGWAGGGFMALRRSSWDQAPLDPRFQGWGGEDAAWHLALVRMTGRGWRGRADLWHLWHPPQPRINRIIGSEESARLLTRYQRAHTRQQMSDLLAEVSHGSPNRAQPQGRP